MMDAAVQEVATVLRLRHRIIGEDDFTVTSQQETIETLRETTNSFVIFLGAIAGISLLVGGIGIMNIMLVSVTERTREIGIRKAMGAKRRGDPVPVRFRSDPAESGWRGRRSVTGSGAILAAQWQRPAGGSAHSDGL
jgi:hypothetical protein